MSGRHVQELKETTATLSLATETLNHIKALNLKPMTFSKSPVSGHLLHITQTVEGLDELEAAKKIENYKKEHVPLMEEYGKDKITALEYYLQMGKIAKRHDVFSCTAGIGLGLQHIIDNEKVPEEAICWVFSVDQADHELLGFSASGNMRDMVLIDQWLVSGFPIKNSMERESPEMLSPSACRLLEISLKKRCAVERNSMVPIPFLSDRDNRKGFITLRIEYSHTVGEIRREERGLERSERAPDRKMSGPSTSFVHGEESSSLGAALSGPKKRRKGKQKQPVVKEVVAEKTEVNEEKLTSSQPSESIHSQIESPSQSSLQPQVSPLQLSEVSSQPQPQSSKGKSAARKCLETTLCLGLGGGAGYSVKSLTETLYGSTGACVAGTAVTTAFLGYCAIEVGFFNPSRAKQRLGPRAQTMEDGESMQQNEDSTAENTNSVANG